MSVGVLWNTRRVLLLNTVRLFSRGLNFLSPGFFTRNWPHVLHADMCMLLLPKFWVFFSRLHADCGKLSCLKSSHFPFTRFCYVAPSDESVVEVRLQPFVRMAHRSCHLLVTLGDFVLPAPSDLSTFVHFVNFLEAASIDLFPLFNCM